MLNNGKAAPGRAAHKGDLRKNNAIKSSTTQVHLTLRAG